MLLERSTGNQQGQLVPGEWTRIHRRAASSNPVAEILAAYHIRSRGGCGCNSNSIRQNPSIYEVSSEDHSEAPRDSSAIGSIHGRRIRYHTWSGSYASSLTLYSHADKYNHRRASLVDSCAGNLQPVYRSRFLERTRMGPGIRHLGKHYRDNCECFPCAIFRASGASIPWLDRPCSLPNQLHVQTTNQGFLWLPAECLWYNRGSQYRIRELDLRFIS